MLVPSLHIFSSANRNLIVGFDVRDYTNLVKNKVVQCTEEVYSKVQKLNDTVDIGLGYISLDEIKDIIVVSDIKINKEYFKDEEFIVSLRKSYKLKAKKLLDTRIKNDSFDEDFYSYLMDKEYLEYKGFRIRGDNEVSVIKEIIATDDEELINRMQNFLDVKESLGTKYQWYKIYKEFKIQVDKIQSPLELEKLYNEYCERFY